MLRAAGSLWQQERCKCSSTEAARDAVDVQAVPLCLHLVAIGMKIAFAAHCLVLRRTCNYKHHTASGLDIMALAALQQTFV